MSFEKKYEKDPEPYKKKVLKTQKIKLYNIKHWIFDFGGVMVETPNIIKKLTQIMSTDYGVEIAKTDPFVSKNRRKLSSGRISSREFLELIFNRYNIQTENSSKRDSQNSHTVDYYLDLWFEMYTRMTQLSPDMEEIINRLHKAGYTVSLLSNTYDIHARSNHLKGFFDLFDHVFLSNEIGFRKPEIEKYKYVLNKLEAKPKECIFIDDKLMNLVPARKLGMTVIQFHNFESFRFYLNELGIEEIEENLKHKIKTKYRKYVNNKKAYETVKSEYKKARKKFKKIEKKKKAKKLNYLKYRRAKKAFMLIKKDYINKREEYKRFKQIKKNKLESKFKLEPPLKNLNKSL